ncbi:MAG: hypothetical protein HOW97_18030 [Catenulispora sp.]|nr:hypothetical protein [Catenulispora sp.]
MTTALPGLPDVDLDLHLFAGVGDELAAEAVAWLTDPGRTAHPLVTLPTAVLMAQAVGEAPGTAAAELLPGRAWRLMPDRVLALRSRRRVEVTVAQHLHLTAEVLERWGWAHTGTRGRSRTLTGRRCILGAQHVVHALGYGTDHVAFEAARQIQGTLHNRGIHLRYDQWNESPRVTADMALALVREAAKGAH